MRQPDFGAAQPEKTLFRRRRRQAAETPSVPNSKGHGVTSHCGLPLARLAVNVGGGAGRAGTCAVYR
ncbi:hypothetical protein, partial [Mesorhizobium sp. M1A.F.Ca.ET.072.01.1.1]|uniref:hypothetical protein n=1 Tax=Mesorhizobium sp. M1A.F.Ca.ET.072.01.1.1 TaxID=2496753 RepID=UPI001AED0DDF